MKNIICILVFVFSLIFISPNKASAQDLLSNPFLSATSIKKLHEQNFKASQKLVYEIKNTAPNKNEETEIINIYLSKNWALVERGDYKILFDFVLQREFVINAKNNSFYSKSLIGPVFFRIMERQNRIAIADIISQSTKKSFGKQCDADTELGLTLDLEKSGKELSQNLSNGVFELKCDNRTIGAFTSSKTQLSNKTLWPVFANILNINPNMIKALKQSDFAPSSLTSSFKYSENANLTTNLKLLKSEKIELDYPLTDDLINQTSTEIDAITEKGLGKLAQDAINNNANGEAIDWNKWNLHLQQLSKHNDNAIKYAFFPSYVMFPNKIANCKSYSDYAICKEMLQIKEWANNTDFKDFFAIIESDSKKNYDNAIAPFSRIIKNNKNIDGAILQSYALVLFDGGDEFIEKAKAAGLPTDSISLRVKALKQYPYNPAYWTDFSNYFARDYSNMENAIWFLEIAYFLPVEGAHNYKILIDSAKRLGKISNDFPQFFR